MPRTVAGRRDRAKGLRWIGAGRGLGRVEHGTRSGRGRRGACSTTGRCAFGLLPQWWLHDCGSRYTRSRIWNRRSGSIRLRGGPSEVCWVRDCRDSAGSPARFCGCSPMGFALGGSGSLLPPASSSQPAFRVVSTGDGWSAGAALKDCRLRVSRHLDHWRHGDRDSPGLFHRRGVNRGSTNGPAASGSQQPAEESATVAALQARIAELEMAAQYRAPSAKAPAARSPPTPKGPSLFAGHPQRSSLGAADWAKLQNLAGRPPPRVSAKETRRSAVTQPVVRQDDIYADLEREAIGDQETEELFSKVELEKLDPMQQLLVAQMKQNQLLLKRLTTPRHSDPVMASLSGGDNASGSGSSGVKGCVARDTFVRTVADLSLVARVVRNNALKELGMPESKEDGSLLQTYMEKRVPLADHRLLSFLATMIGEGWRIGFESDNIELLGVMGRMSLFLEQCAIDSGKTQLAWLMCGWTEPPWHQLSSNRKKVGLEPFARLCHPSWVSANLAYLKDLDYMEARMNSIGRPTKAAAGDDTLADPKKPPKPPKGKGKKNQQGQEDSSA